MNSTVSSVPSRPVRIVGWRQHRRAHVAVGKDRSVELGRLARLALVEPQAGGQFVCHRLSPYFLRGPTSPNIAPCGSTALTEYSPPGISIGPLYDFAAAGLHGFGRAVDVVDTDVEVPHRLRQARHGPHDGADPNAGVLEELIVAHLAHGHSTLLLPAEALLVEADRSHRVAAPQFVPSDVLWLVDREDVTAGVRIALGRDRVHQVERRALRPGDHCQAADARLVPRLHHHAAAVALDLLDLCIDVVGVEVAQPDRPRAALAHLVVELEDAPGHAAVRPLDHAVVDVRRDRVRIHVPADHAIVEALARPGRRRSSARTI